MCHYIKFDAPVHSMIWFDCPCGISTLVGLLMLNPVYTYILYILFVSVTKIILK